MKSATLLIVLLSAAAVISQPAGAPPQPPSSFTDVNSSNIDLSSANGQPSNAETIPSSDLGSSSNDTATPTEPPVTDACPQHTDKQPLPWAYYSFDFDFDRSMNLRANFTDNSGNQRDGLSNGDISGIFAYWKNGALFSKYAGPQHIEIMNSSNFEPPFSFAVWVDLKGQKSDAITIAQTPSWNIVLHIDLNELTVHADRDYIFNLYPLTDNNFFHVAVTVDVQGNILVYKDGQKAGNSQRGKFTTYNGNIEVLKHNGGFSGVFDDFFAFNYALGTEEVWAVRDLHCGNFAGDFGAPTSSSEEGKVVTHYYHSGAVETQLVRNTASTSGDSEQSTMPAPQLPSPPAPETSPLTSEIAQGSTPSGVPYIYWSQDTQPHGSCPDNSGHDRNGYWYGPVGSGVAGKVRGATFWDGKSNQCISYNKFDVDMSSFTVAFWIQYLDIGTYKLVSTKNKKNDVNGFELELSITSGQSVTFYGTDGNKAVWDISGTLGSRSWFHLAVTVSGSQVTLYVNGESVGTRTVEPVRRGGALWVGNNQLKQGQLAGAIDEFTIFESALNAGQIYYVQNTYNDVSTSSWSSSGETEWGVNWEKAANLSDAQKDRVNNWWKL